MCVCLHRNIELMMISYPSPYSLLSFIVHASQIRSLLFFLKHTGQNGTKEIVLSVGLNNLPLLLVVESLWMKSHGFSTRCFLKQVIEQNNLVSNFDRLSRSLWVISPPHRLHVFLFMDLDLRRTEDVRSDALVSIMSIPTDRQDVIHIFRRFDMR